MNYNYKKIYNDSIELYDYGGGGMDTYELIEQAVQIGLFTVEVAHAIHNYIQKDKRSYNEEKLRKVIEEALKYFEEQNNYQKFKEPFSNINLLNQFMITTQSISNTTIEEVCDRIMSHELVSPGVTPQRIMQILSTISFEDFQKFQIICSMYIGIITDYNNDSGNGPNADKHVMVPLKNTDEYSEKINIYLDDINELQAIGLIAYSNGGYYISGISCKHPLIYANGKTFYVLWHYKDELPIGNILLTKAGKCIANVINECDIADGYDTDIHEYMEHYDVEFAEQDMYNVFKTDGWFGVRQKKKKRYNNS